MASLLGKRKRRSPPKDPLGTEEPLEANLDYQDALRRHFEATFEPMEAAGLAKSDSSLPKVDESSDSSTANAGNEDSETDWSGLSDSGEIQIVSHESVSILQDDEMVKSYRKHFMSSKPPTTSQASSLITSRSQKPEKTDIKSAASLTAEDLALQRLLSESHLLSGSTSTVLTPSLKARQQAQDLRIQGLGAKKSATAIEAGNIPMAVRKGMEKKRSMKERDRRKEAKDAGIVLERDAKSSDSGRSRKRGKDVGAPAVGRWKGGTLVLGKRDVAEIESQRLATDFGKKGGGGRNSRRR